MTITVKVLTLKISEHIKKILHQEQLRFNPENQDQFLKSKGGKKHLIIFTDDEKAFNKIQYPFLEKIKKVTDPLLT